jgi:3-dehydroquinate dehydratase I
MGWICAVRRTIRSWDATRARKMPDVSLISPLIAGTIHSPAALQAALRLSPGAVDLLEVRVDHFANNLGPLRRSIGKLPAPLIITVRHPREGGAPGLSLRTRRALYAEFLPHATLVDLDLRSSRPLRDILKATVNYGKKLILSDHRFDATPSLANLIKRRAAALAAGADIFKVASLVRSPADFATLLTFVARSRDSRPAVSAMGMGEFGKVSRLALARSGSVLNYGYLGNAQVSGQWPAIRFRERLAEL